MNRPRTYGYKNQRQSQTRNNMVGLVVGGTNLQSGPPTSPTTVHQIYRQKPQSMELSQSQVYPKPVHNQQRIFKISTSEVKTKRFVLSETSSPERQSRKLTIKNTESFKDETIKLNRINTDFSEDDMNSQAIDKFEDRMSDHSFDATPEGQPMILYSRFSNRPPTLFFQYPPIRSVNKPDPPSKQDIQHKMRQNVYGQVPYKCVVSAFESAGVQRHDDDDQNWNILWGIGNRKTMKAMNKNQRMNHFPGCWNMGRKDNLWINLSKMKRKFPKDYDFVPNTYLLAYDYDRFLAQKEIAPKGTLWIMKPCAAARGRGIRMISKKSKVSQKKNYLVMDYISRPHLVNNFKYDLRVYVLILGFDPLRVYIYNEGLVRFATEAYSLSHKDLSKKYVHLTNFSVNKRSPTFVVNKQSEEDGQGSKWSLSALKRKYTEMGIDVNQLFSRISDVILKTCIASEPFMLDQNAKSPDHRSNFFELYGFDILVDQDLKPWVLEVNVCPSLNSSSPLDKKIKTALISDILHLVGVPLWDKTKKKNNSTVISPQRQQHQLYPRNINDVSQINMSNCVNRLSPDDWNTLQTIMEEQSRCGGFQCVYPTAETITFYQKFFEFPRYNNKMIERYFQDGQRWLDRLQ